MARTLRIGTVPWLVARPLTAGLDRRPGVELHSAPPALLARGLRRGELDIALASSILALPPEGLPLWTEGPLVASRGPVRSVLLFLRPGLEEPSRVRSLAVDPDSRTGAALARILLRELGARPRAYPAEEDPWRADAVLRIGDPALREAARRRDWRILDLGETWHRLTRLPFVYAGWIGRRDFPLEEAAPLLEEAARAGLPQREHLAAEHAAALGLDPVFLRTYLTEDLHYRLDPAEARAALEAFALRLQGLRLAAAGD